MNSGVRTDLFQREGAKNERGAKVWIVIVLVAAVGLGTTACSGDTSPNHQPDSSTGMDAAADRSDAGADAEVVEDIPTEPATRCQPHPLDDANFEETTVFQGGSDGYPVYRIPSVVTTPNGVVVAFSEARPTIQDPGSGLIDVVMKRSLDCGRTWSELYVLAEAGTGDAHDPAAVVAPDGDGTDTLWLFYNKRPASEGGEFDLPIGLGPDSASVWVQWSTDDGVTWSEEREITTSVKDPSWAIASTGPGLAINTEWGNDVAPAGRLLVPGWYSSEGPGGSFVFASDDGGETFRLMGLPEAGTSEPQLVELTDGSLVLDARQAASVDPPHRRLFRSVDGGETWAAPEDGLEMTPIMSSVLRYSAERDGGDRDRLLHSGPSATTRAGMRVWLSYDEGETWVNETVIEEGFAQYSVLTKLDDGSIGMLYEGFGSTDGPASLNIRFARFNLGYLGE